MFIIPVLMRHRQADPWGFLTSQSTLAYLASSRPVRDHPVLFKEEKEEEKEKKKRRRRRTTTTTIPKE